MTERTIVIVGGTHGIGRELAASLVARGDRVILSGRDAERAATVAAELGDRATGIAVDLSEPEGSQPSSRASGGARTGARRGRARRQHRARLRHRAGAAARHPQAHRVHRDRARADRPPRRVARHRHRALRRAREGRALPRLDHGLDHQRRHRRAHPHAWRSSSRRCASTRSTPASSATVRSGRARPPRSTATSRRTPGGELATMDDIVAATTFLLDNHGMSGTSIHVDRGWRLTCQGLQDNRTSASHRTTAARHSHSTRRTP